MPDRRLGVYQATKAFPELTTTRLYIAFAKGQISAVRQGQRLYFLPADLERFRVSLGGQAGRRRAERRVDGAAGQGRGASGQGESVD